MLLLTPIYIKLAKNFRQPIRKDGPATHLVKKNTATLGGLLMMLVFGANVVLWCHRNVFVEAALICGVGYGCIGLCDDVLKLLARNSKGLNAKIRLILGVFIALILLGMLHHIYKNNFVNSIYIPYAGHFCLPIGLLVILWVPLVMVGTANAVNLTDGLDGLLSLVATLVMAAFAVVVFNIGHAGVNANFFAARLHNGVLLRQASELLIICASLIGVLLGFLCFNCYPAKIFMGDVGSLFIGGVIGSVAILLKHELLLLLAGIIFVLEAVSVILQVGFYKLTKRRIFLMAPLHHHFEKKGMHENTIVSTFLVITILGSALGLMFIL